MCAFNGIFLVGMFCTIAGVNAENKSESTDYHSSPLDYGPLWPSSAQDVFHLRNFPFPCFSESQATRQKSYISTTMYVDPCRHYHIPCIIVAGQIYNVSNGFYPLEEVSGGHVNLEVFMYNNPAHMWLPFPGFKTLNLCDQLLGGVSCPLKARHEVYFRSSLLLPNGDTLLSILPKLLTLRWIIRDNSGKPIFCRLMEACNSKECISNELPP